MKYSALLCLLLCVVSTDGFRVIGKWDKGSVSRLRLELNWAQIRFFQYAKISGVFAIKLFEHDLIKVMKWVSQAKINKKKAAREIMDRLQITFKHNMDKAEIREYIESTCEAGQFPALETISINLFSLRNEINNILPDMCDQLLSIDPVTKAPGKGRARI